MVAFVASQFVAYTLPGTGLTFAKLASLFLLPAGLCLMGYVRMSGALALFALVLGFGYVGGVVAAEGPSSPLVPGAMVEIIVAFVGALALYTALTSGPGMIEVFGRFWICAGVLAAALAVLQSAGLAPLFVLSSNDLGGRETGVAGILRGTGLQFDPNFAAAVLGVALAFALWYAQRWRIAVLTILVLGIIATFSRMGVILVVVTFIGMPLIEAWTAGTGLPRALRRTIGLALGVVVVTLALFALAPSGLQTYMNERRDDAVAALGSLTGQDATFSDTPGTVNASSGERRSELAEMGVQLAQSSWPFGMGADRLPVYLVNETDVGTNALHNTYLELLVTGGIFGAIALALIVVLAIATLSRRTEEMKRERAALISVCVVFAITWLFLTLIYNSLFWVPIVLILAYARLSRGELAPRVLRPATLASRPRGALGLFDDASSQ